MGLRCDGMFFGTAASLPANPRGESAEERDMAAYVGDVQNAGVEAIVEIRCQIGDFVGEINQLCLKRRTKIEEIFGEFRMS